MTPEQEKDLMQRVKNIEDGIDLIVRFMSIVTAIGFLYGIITSILAVLSVQ